MSQSSSYVIGKGKLYFNQFLDGQTAASGRGSLYLGNTPALSITRASTKVEHYSSEQAVKVKDASVLTQVDQTGTFTTDNIDVENLALWYGSTGAQSLTQVATTVAAADAPFVGLGNRYYQLGATDQVPQGVQMVNSVAVSYTPLAGGASATAVAGTDYTVDTNNGLLKVIKGGALDGANVTVSYKLSARVGNVVLSSATKIVGSMMFISDNTTGPNRNYFMPNVTLAPSGTYALKGDEFQQIQFDFEALQLGDVDAIIISSTGVAPT